MKTMKFMFMVFLVPFQLCAAQPNAAFHPTDLVALDLANVGDFWKDDKPAVREDRSAANFQRDKTYVGGLRYATARRNKTIEVAVFKSEGDAVKAMEALRADVSIVIVPGDTNRFGELTWWFTSDRVFVNCRNTIVTVCWSDMPQQEKAKVKSVIEEAAATVADRIQRTNKTSNKPSEATSQ